jgi:exodeoxyribonuclease V beta subunit
VPVAFVKKPHILQGLSPTGHVVIEASAGTGKTYTIERLVIDQLLRPDHPCRLEQVLVVTFTERATKELRIRIRRILEDLRADGAREQAPVIEEDADAGEHAQATYAWRIDDEALERIEQALNSFDAAPIYTIHGFCQRVLTEHAFASQRPLQQRFADTKVLFERAFMRALRQHLAVDPLCRGYLMRWQSSHDLDALHALLLGCHQQMGEVWPQVDVAALGVMTRHLVQAIEAAGGLEALFSLYGRSNLYAADLGRLREDVFPALAKAVKEYKGLGGEQALPALLEALEGVESKWSLLFAPRLRKPSRGEITFGDDFSPEAQGFVEAARAFGEVRVPFQSMVVQLFLPVVQRDLADLKQQEGYFDYNDMLLLVQRALQAGDAASDSLRQSLRARYRVALIDEFQDTDPIQWEIFQRLFVEGEDEGHRLFVIGDPKQAIYAFRGADVHTYLKACRALQAMGGATLHLTENYRSTEALIRACNAIFDQRAPRPLFQGPITYTHPVTCGRVGWALRPNPKRAAALEAVPSASAAAIHLWRIEPPRGQSLQVGTLREVLGRRIAQEIAWILEQQPWSLRGRDGGGDGIAPHDIFVLTRTNAEAVEVGDHLRQRGVPFTFFAVNQLFGGGEAQDVLDLLAAIAHPGDRSARMRAWLTPFFDLTVVELEACADLPDSHPLVARLLEWNGLARARSYEALFSAVIGGSGIVRRALFLSDSDREVENYLHIFDILQDEVCQSRLTIAELLDRLRDFIEGRRQPLGYQDGEGVLQRFGGSMDAVQVMTVHKSKGLEASVVFWAGGFTGTDVRVPFVFHDADGKRRVATMRGDEAYQKASFEAWYEDQRLVYVALTRAKARLYLPCVSPQALQRKAASSPQREGTFAMLNSRLLQLTEGGLPPDLSWEVVNTDAALARADQPQEEDGATAPTSVSAPSLGRWSPPASLLAVPARPAQLDAVRARRLILTSYTRMKAAAAAAATLASAADASGADDVPASVTIPEGELPGGTATGLLLHDALEHIPFATAARARDLDTWRALPEVRRCVDAATLRHPIDPSWRVEVERVLFCALTRPLSFGEARLPLGLCEVTRVVKEMAFLYPIPEAHHPSLAHWGQHIAQGSPRPVRIERGFIKGFIDLIFEHQGRVYLADWKSDALLQYGPQDLRAHVEAHYSWQAKLYTIALTRWLRAFDRPTYEARFGGVLYLFLRGLAAAPSLAAAPEGLHFERLSWLQVIGFEQDLKRGEVPVC